MSQRKKKGPLSRARWILPLSLAQFQIHSEYIGVCRECQQT